LSVIDIEQLTRRYGRRVGVERLQLSVPEGTIYGFLGPNGAGKTTTIRVLLGMLRPSEGKARIFGRDCWRDSRLIKSDVGYLPGDLHLYPWMTCRSALQIIGRVRGRDLSLAGDELASDFSLEQDVRVRRMSRGMRQKLGLILALVHRPKLVVLDEPTASLDPLMQEKLHQHLRRLARAGHTVFFSSHTLSEVEQLCDHVAVLRQGTLVAEDRITALRSRASRVVTIVWREGVRLEEIKTPPFIDVYEQQGRTWRATLIGVAMDLVRWAAEQPIDDLVIGQPDLASLFQEYYE